MHHKKGPVEKHHTRVNKRIGIYTQCDLTESTDKYGTYMEITFDHRYIVPVSMIKMHRVRLFRRSKGPCGRCTLIFTVTVSSPDVRTDIRETESIGFDSEYLHQESVAQSLRWKRARVHVNTC
ncbi:hypothetical protein CSKR_111524, partial [Clonorchis sinensis]